MLPCSDMVFPQIGKHCRIKHNSIYPVHFQRLRRNFHDNVLTALIHHFSQYFIQFIRFRCSVADCLLPCTITNLYRSDQTTLLTIRRKHFPDHPCGRCLSFRPSHTDDFQFFLRIVKPLTGDRCQRSPRVRSFQYTIFLLLSSLLWTVIFLPCSFFCQDHHSAPFHCLPDKCMPILPASPNADKQSPRFYISAVVCHLLHFPGQFSPNASAVKLLQQFFHLPHTSLNPCFTVVFKIWSFALFCVSDNSLTQSFPLHFCFSYLEQCLNFRTKALTEWSNFYIRNGNWLLNFATS